MAVLMGGRGAFDVSHIEARAVPKGQKYPWDLWTDGRVYRVEQGADFTCEMATMRTNIYEAGYSRGLRVETHLVNDTVWEFQFHNDDRWQERRATRAIRRQSMTKQEA